MTGLDHSLIYEARKFITGENVHDVRTWIFCYENSQSDSKGQEWYEKLLREFVATKRLNMAIDRKGSLFRSPSETDPHISDALNRMIDEKFV